MVCYSSLVLIALIGIIEPYDVPFDYRHELANEFAILVVFALLLCQTEFIKDTQGKSLSGWALIFFIVLLIIVNFGIVLVINLTTLKSRTRRCYLKGKWEKDQLKRAKAAEIRKEAVKKYEME